MGIPTRRGRKSPDSKNEANYAPTVAAFAGVSTSDTPQNPTHPTAPVEPGDRIIAKGFGKHSIGTVIPGVVPTLRDLYIQYRCDFNKGVHVAEAGSVTKLKPRSD